MEKFGDRIYKTNTSIKTRYPFFQAKIKNRAIESKYNATNVQAFVQSDDGKDKPPSEKAGSIDGESLSIEVKASSGSHCDPVGVSYADFLKKTGNIDDAFGITKFGLSDVIFPEVILSKGKLKKTDADVQVHSFYLLPQTFKVKDPTIMSEDGDKFNHYCPRGTYDLYWIITKSASEKIKEGEQEHCNDINLAFNLSLAKFKNAVNSSAGKKFTSLKKAKAYLKKKTKVDPDDWNNYFMSLAKKSEQRDKMNWHLPKNYRTRINQACDKAETILTSAHLSEIGKHPSSEIIN